MTTTKRLLVSDHALQQTVGWIAFLMPIAVRLLAYLSPDQIWTTNSISAYYYSSARDVFVSALVVGGLVLAFYDSQHPRDRVVARIAGLAAVGIGLFPMKISQGVLVSKQTLLPDDETKLVEALQNCPHGPLGLQFIFVGLFFALTFYLVTFRFKANTPAMPTNQTRQRNKLYRFFGYLMGIAFVWIGILEILDQQHSIFWPETLAVMAFAAAWLVKGQLVLKDKAPAGMAASGAAAV